MIAIRRTNDPGRSPYSLARVGVVGRSCSGIADRRARCVLGSWFPPDLQAPEPTNEPLTEELQRQLDEVRPTLRRMWDEGR
jgi:hypothetical protein